MEEDKQRLEDLQLQASKMENVPAGLKLAIKTLKEKLGITACDLGDDCLSCGS